MASHCSQLAGIWAACHAAAASPCCVAGKCNGVLWASCCAESGRWASCCFVGAAWQVKLTSLCGWQVNVMLMAEGKDPYSNTRNAAAGSLMLKDPIEVGKRRLSFMAYQLLVSAR